MTNIKLFACTWETDTAGPSPDNNMRTELFFMGCKRAAVGAACSGCFNQELWKERSEAKTYTPQEIADQVERYAPNKYITIGGGEPTDQIDGLIELCKLLKAKGFHIIVYTWYSLREIMEYPLSHEDYVFRAKMTDLLQYIDILIDGEYKQGQRIYQQEVENGFSNSVGSGNQMIWDVHEYTQTQNGIIRGMYAADIYALHIVPHTNELKYLTKTENDFYELSLHEVGAA